MSRAYANAGSVSHYKIEERVAIPAVHANNWGTPDTWIFGHNATSGRARLVVIDYKFGHEFVEVFENWQLVDYLFGILQELGISGEAAALVDVEEAQISAQTPLGQVNATLTMRQNNGAAQ